MKNITSLVTQISFTFLIFMLFSLVIFPTSANGQQQCQAPSTPSVSAATGQALGQLVVSSSMPEEGTYIDLLYSIDNTNFNFIGNLHSWYEQTTFTVNYLDTNKTYTFYANAHAGSRFKQASTRVGGDQDAGGTFCEMKVGHPVNVSNGNMYFMQTDYNLPGVGENINLTRTYNSMFSYSGLFGSNFSTQYDENLIVQNDNTIRLSMSDGRAVYFARTDPNAAFAPVTRGFYGQIVKNADATYTLTFKNGRVHQFGADGRLSWLKDLSGNQTTLNYNQNGQLTGITDSVGRTLTVTLNDFGYVGSVSDALGVVASYTYNSDGTLKTVDYPDGSKYQFIYIAKTVNGVNRSFLTEVRNALGYVLEKHDYDSSGRATTSEKDGGVEKYTLDYSNLTHTAVTDALGRVTKYYYDRSRGRAVTTKIGNAEFEPQLVKKNQKRFDGLDETIISLYARGMTTREIQGHLEEIYGVDVSPCLDFQRNRRRSR